MKKVLKLSIVALSLILSSCDRLSNTTEKIGETAGGMVKGIETGVKKARAINLNYTESLTEKGISNGKVTLKNDKEGTDNLLSVYLIFSKKFRGKILAKAYDNQGLEMGRSTVKVEAQEGDAGFYDFHFDKRTNIDRDGRIVLE
jgi:protein involved in sex pheromone biosynthesis